MADTPLLRAGLLDGRVIALAGAGPFGDEVGRTCRALGARVERFDPDTPGDRPPEALVIDAAGRFAAAPSQGLAPLRAAVDHAWVAARAAATQTLIGAPQGGKIVLLAPPPGAGPHAGATRDALENMARTLSIEWARYEIRVTAIHPGAATEPAEVAHLVAYVASPAGDYFSGCVFSLGET